MWRSATPPTTAASTTPASTPTQTRKRTSPWPPTPQWIRADAATIAGDAVETAVDQTLDAAATVQEVVQEPVVEVPAPAEEALAADLTAADTYEADDAGSAVVDDAFVEEPRRGAVTGGT